MNIKSTLSRLLSLVFFFLSIDSAFGWIWNLYEYRDLEGTDAEVFAAEASQWTPSSLSGYQRFFPCASTYLLGGYAVLGSQANSYPAGFGYQGTNGQYGQYFTRTFTLLPSHSMIYYTMTFYVLDYWRGPQNCWLSSTCQDHWDLTIAGSTYSGWVFDYYTDYSGLPSICGTSFSDFPNIKLFGRISHSSSTLTITITSRLAGYTSTSSWGIREVNILSATSPAYPGYLTDLCARAPYSLPSNTISTCYCSPGTYQYTSGGFNYCGSCYFTCSTCFEYGPQYCYECASPYYWDGTQCTSPTFCWDSCLTCTGTGVDQCTSCVANAYLYNGNTCIPACPSPLVAKLINSVPNCVFPCGPNLFLDWNNECQPFCDFPLQTIMTNTLVGPVPQCIYPCLTTQHLYWDGSCQTSCPLPFGYNLIRNRNFCNWTCPIEPNTILYWDNSCNSTMCQFPIQVTIQYNRTFCTYPCTTGQWLYSNGSCLSYCQDHFIPGSFAGKLFCNFPCPINLNLLDNGTCIGTCLLNYVNITLRYEKYCFYPCLPTEYYYSTNGSCLSYCDWRFIYSTYSNQNYCAHPCTVNQYLYLNGSCLTYCEPYYTPWFDYNRKYCENPCNNSVIYNNGTCASSCATGQHFIAGSRGSDLTCTFPCRPSEYLYTNGSCLLSCSPHYIPLTYGTDDFCEYPCATTQYLYSNGTCLSVCDTPYTDYLYGGDPICVAPCDAENYYYNNGSCLASCPSLFIENIYGTEKFCHYPCDTLEFLYINGSCLSSCRSDFTTQTYGTDNYCNYPCSPTEYLYDNKSCISSCPLPWVNETTIFGYFCHFACADPSDYSYWNGTCSLLCPFPLTSYTEGSFSFCISPCTSDQYLYSNGLCVSSCPSPYTSSTIDEVNLCSSPCTSTSEYLFWNGSCIDASCLYPFRAKYSGTTSAVCLLPCDNITHYFYFEEGVCREYCSYEGVLRSEGYLECQEAPGFLDWISTPPIDADAMTTVVLSKNLMYLKYFNIKLPPRLERLRTGGGKFVLTFKHGAVVPSLFYEGFDMNSLPEKFEKRGIHSSFFINFWNLLTFMMVFFGLGLIFTFLEYQFKAWNLKYWRLIMERLKNLLFWNFFIILFANNADFIVLYSSLEFQTLTFNSFAAVFSFIFCLIVCVLTLAVPIAAYYLGYAIYQQKKRAIQTKSNDDYMKFLEKWEIFQVLFRGFNTDSPLQTIFYAIYTIRIASPMAAASFLYSVPLAQIVIDLVLSITIILYLAVLRPMKRIVNNIQLIILELLILAVNICMTIFAINDLFDINLTYRMASLGDAVIVCNFLMNILILVILGYKVFWILKNAWDLRKRDGLHTFMTLLQLALLPVQQTAFGFETMQVARFDTTYHDLNEDFYSDKKFDPTIQVESSHNKKVNKSLFESSSNEILDTSFVPLTNNNSNTSLIRGPMRLNQSQNRLRMSKNRNINSQEFKQHESPNNPSRNIPRISSRMPTDNSSQSNLGPSIRYDNGSQIIQKGQQIELTPSHAFNQESSVEIGYHRPPIITYNFADPMQQGHYQITGNNQLPSQDYDFAPETDDRYYTSQSREITPPPPAMLYNDIGGGGMSRVVPGDQPVIVTDRDQDFTNRSQMFSGVRFLSPIPHSNMPSFSPNKDAGDDFVDVERSAKKRR